MYCTECVPAIKYKILYARVYIEDEEVGEVGERVPLAAHKLDRPDEHNGAQLVLRQVRRAQRHHEVREPNRRRIRVRQHTNDDVAAQAAHVRRVARLHRTAQNTRLDLNESPQNTTKRTWTIQLYSTV